MYVVNETKQTVMVNGSSIYPAKATYLPEHYNKAPVIVKKKSSGEFKVFSFESQALNYVRFFTRTKVLCLDTLLGMISDAGVKAFVKAVCSSDKYDYRSVINWVGALRCRCIATNVLETKEFTLAKTINSAKVPEAAKPESATVEEPKHEEPVEGKPVEIPVAEEPVVQETVVQEAPVEPVVVEEPAVEEPVSEPFEEPAAEAAVETPEEQPVAEDAPKSKKKNRKK